MTNTQINFAIDKITGCDGRDCRCDDCNPDWCRDLNAMHRAEEALNPIDRDHYIDTLGGMFDGSWAFALATARQRAEAFLRTLGKWEEVQG